MIVHGQIAQFDSFTGTDQFLASVSATPDENYGDLAIVKGTKTDLASLVLDDTFKAEVTVVGATTYQEIEDGRHKQRCRAVRGQDHQDQLSAVAQEAIRRRFVRGLSARVHGRDF